MSKEVDNGIKKFFVILLCFIIVLNVFSIVLFSHSLFYYFSNYIEIYTGFVNHDFSTIYNNILRYSMIGKCLIPIILICFCLFLSFTIKHVKKYRKYVYPILYIVFLFIVEFIVLCFFKECLPYMKSISTSLVPVLDLDDSVYPYISIFHPIRFMSCVIYSVLITIRNIFDNKSVGKKNSWYMIVIIMILSFIIAVLIGMIVSIILSNI